EADLRAGGERRSGHDVRVDVGEVAVRPLAAVLRGEREADAAARVVRPGALDDAVGQRVDRRALGRGDVGGRVVVVRVADADEAGAAADGEDVAGAVVRGAGEQRPRARVERGRLRGGARRVQRRLGLLQVGLPLLDDGVRLRALLLDVAGRLLEDE